MENIGTVALIQASTGGFALQVEDGSYVLAEQLDRHPLVLGQRLSGNMRSIGVEDWRDVNSDAQISVFTKAYDCSFDAVQYALS